MVEWYISKNLKGGFFLKDEKDFKASAAEAEEKIEAELDKSEDYEQQRLNEELEKLAETFRAEMKKAKDPAKPDYLSTRLDILDDKGNKLGSVFDILTESEAQLARYKLHRFLTALELKLTSFELKDLTKIIVGKKFKVDLKIENQEGYAARTVVDALTNEIYYPFNTDADCPFDAVDSADTTPDSEAEGADEY